MKRPIGPTSNAPASRTADTPRLTEAARWAIDLEHSEHSPERTAAWLSWCEESPHNLSAFERVQQLSDALGELPPERKRQLLAALLPPPSSHSCVPRRVRFRRLSIALAAACVLIAAGAFTILSLQGGRAAPIRWLAQIAGDRERTIETARGEHRTVNLADGTRIELGAATRLSAQISPHRRALKLLAGEAYLQVIHDPTRPFTLDAGAVHISDVGTEFDVRRTGNRVTVSVEEGAVDVDAPSSAAASATSTSDPERPSSSTTPAPPAAPVESRAHLHAGERLMADPALRLARITTTDRHATGAWRTGRLDFQDEPLSEVIANINRYAAHPIVITDPTAAEHRFTGTVFVNDIDAWVDGVSRLFSLKTRLIDGRIHLEPTRPPSPGAPSIPTISPTASTVSSSASR